MSSFTLLTQELPRKPTDSACTTHLSRREKGKFPNRNPLSGLSYTGDISPLAFSWFEKNGVWWGAFTCWAQSSFPKLSSLAVQPVYSRRTWMFHHHHHLSVLAMPSGFKFSAPPTFYYGFFSTRRAV